MKKTATLSLIILLNIVFINISLGQSQSKFKIYNQNDFEKNKAQDEVYQLRWYKNIWVPDAKDTLPYFVDDRDYKGIINYGVTFKRRDYIDFNFFESKTMCFFKIEISKCNYNPKDSVVNIEGFVSGSLNELVRNNIRKNYIDIFLGEKTDTVNACYFGNASYDKIINKDTIESKLNNKEIDDFTVLDTFPAFYFKNYSYHRTAAEGRQPFKISGKVRKNTLLAFGSRGHYSEIFDLGSMIYYPQENNRKKIIKRQELDCRTLIIKNRLVSDIEKEKVQKEEIKYYTYTQNAENYILIRQYVKAKEEYNFLSQNYPTLFAKDIHNAIRCALLSRDFKTAFWWGEKLASKGVELPYFNSKIFAGMRKNSQWKTFSMKYDSICKLTKNNLNLKLKKELTDLLNEDQADYGLENRKDPKVLYETTERVTGKLIDLLKKEGYPSEEKTGVYVEKDTILISFPDYTALFRHAVQQKPKNLAALNELLDKSSNAFEYDRKRSSIDVMPYNSCFHIYKGNLYNSKACGGNDLMVRKMTYMFSNTYGFIINYGNFIVSEYNSKNPKEWDDYYAKNYNFIMKLTEDWEFYEK